MIILIDNYDSFSYNLYQMLGEMDPEIEVFRNDAITAEEVLAKDPKAIILSPGPGRPAEAGICEDVVKICSGRIPILGVCLGHQAICEAFGAKIVHAGKLMHGKQSVASLSQWSLLFKGLPEKIKVARYHSLAVQPETLPKGLRASAVCADGEIMAVEHERAPVFGLQFHPESIMTEEGRGILKNFLAIADSFPRNMKESVVLDETASFAEPEIKPEEEKKAETGSRELKETREVKRFEPPVVEKEKHPGIGGVSFEDVKATNIQGVERSPEEEVALNISSVRREHSDIFDLRAATAVIAEAGGIKVLTEMENPPFRFIGVSREELTETTARELESRGVKRAMTVFGQDITDDISLSAPTSVCELNGGRISTYVIRPEDFGLKRCRRDELNGDAAQDNEAILRSIFEGEQGARRNIVLLNAGAVLHIVRDIPFSDGIKMAEEIIDSGKAGEKFEELKGIIVSAKGEQV